MKPNSFITRLNTMNLVFYFCNSFVIFFWVFLFVIHFLAYHEVSIGREVSFTFIIATLLSLMVTRLMWLAKKSDEFFKELSEIKQRAEDATTEAQLYDARKELEKLWKEKSFHPNTGNEAAKVYTFINTRLKYEFKQPIK